MRSRPQDGVCSAPSISRGPLVRRRPCSALRGRTLLLITAAPHHSDGWSVGVMITEMAARLRSLRVGPAGGAAALASITETSPCAARMVKRRTALSQHSRLARGPRGPTCARPAEPIATPAGAELSGAMIEREIGRTDQGAEGAGVRGQGVTLYMTLLAAFKTLLLPLHGRRMSSSARPSPTETGLRSRTSSASSSHTRLRTAPRARPHRSRSSSAACVR